MGKSVQSLEIGGKFGSILSSVVFHNLIHNLIHEESIPYIEASSKEDGGLFGLWGGGTALVWYVHGLLALLWTIQEAFELSDFSVKIEATATGRDPGSVEVPKHFKIQRIPLHHPKIFSFP